LPRLSTLLAATAAVVVSVAALTGCDPDGGGDGAAATVAATASAGVPSGSSPSAGPSAAQSGAQSGKPAGGATSALPAGVWISARAVPLDSAYHWQGPAAVAQSAKDPKFRFETLCRSQRSTDLDGLADGAQAAVAQLGKGGGDDWQAQETILSWGPAKSSGPAQTAFTFAGSLAEEVKACAATVPGATVTVGTEDAGNLLAATITVPQAGGTVTLHEYLATSGATIAELSLWTTSPAGGKPRTPWTAPADATVLKALGSPICVALKDC